MVDSSLRWKPRTELVPRNDELFRLNRQIHDAENELARLDAKKKEIKALLDRLLARRKALATLT